MSDSSTPRSVGSDSGSYDLISSLLPAECNVPGYWDTVASNTSDWAPQISVSRMWREATDKLPIWKKEYRRAKSGVLTKRGDLPQFVGKSADRIREKTYEKILRSSDRGLAISEIFDESTPVPRLEDLVRVRVETQFLDGVPFLAGKLHDLARTYDPEATLERKGKLAGYFAQHLTFRMPVHFRFNNNASSYNVTCEIQVATALATLVWENSHGLYETNRVQPESPEAWQWDPSDPRFLSNQLGHMIHLADGLFCQLRDASPRK